MDNITKLLSSSPGKEEQLDDFYIDLSNYRLLKAIGRDERFMNYKVIDMKTQQTYTAKILDTSDGSISQVKKFIKDIKIMQLCNSPFILKFKGFNISGFEGKPTAILEYTSNRTLRDLLDQIKMGLTDITETQKMMIIYGLASGMAHIHTKQIIHNNLKPNNIYLDSNFLPKIGNFYDSQMEGDDDDGIDEEYKGHSMMLGTPIYVAPEMIDQNKNNKPGDVYSFSFIVHEIMSGEMPILPSYNYRSLFDLLTNKLAFQIDPHIPENFYTLIKRCSDSDPAKRPSFEEILSILKTDEFLNDIDKTQFLNFIESVESNNLNFNFDKIHIDFTEIRKLNVDFSQIDLQLYEKRENIGRGQYGIVYKVKNKSTGENFAAKISIILLEDSDLVYISSLSREINILSQLNFPSILKFVGYSKNDFENEQKTTIITELMENNTLENIIKLVNRGLSPPEWNPTKELIIIYGIASGMAYLHSKNILHRDIKPANIFMDEHLFPIIGDFGLSKDIDDNSPLETNLNIGTPSFMSPEIFERFIYTKAGDVYAFGMLLYQLKTLEHPFKNFSAFQIYRSVISGVRPKFDCYIHPCYKSLIEKCWVQDYQKRITFDEIVDMLENKKEFITDEINVEDYFDYIDYIKNKKVKNSFAKIKIDFEQLKRSQLNDKSLNISNLDLKKFIKQRFISRIDNFEIYEIKNIETNDLFEAKISIFSIIELSRNEIIHLQREVNILSKLNHPSFLKFIGFSLTDFKQQPMPVIVTEMPPNRSLKQILYKDGKHEPINEWDDTKKLITIYGIASGMAYLHSHNVIHRNLTPESVFFDEYLHPKIGNFGLLAQIHSFDTMSYQTSMGIKGNIIYSSPELLESNEYSQSSDVYAFSLIVYEIITSKAPFENIDNFKKIFREVVTKGNRPEFNSDIDIHYRKLIEICWSQEPNERPTFEQIISILQNEKGFITKNVDKKIFLEYIQFIEKSNVKFYSKNKVVKFDDLIKSIDKEIENESTTNALHKELIKSTANLENSIYIKKICTDLLNKKWIGTIDSDNINFIFNNSQPNGSSLTTSNFKFKIGESTVDSDFISLKLFKRKIYQNNLDDEKIHKFIDEYKKINDLNHPNIIKILGYFEGNKNQAPSFIYEFYSRRLKDVIKVIDDAFLITIIYEIGHAMMIVHKRKLIHRNLNINNIFIDSENHVKIDDFGLPILMEASEQVKLTKERLFCLSQQLLQNKDYDEKVDVFAFGMIMQYILRRGKNPFLSRDDINSGKKARIPISLNKLAFSIVINCLSHSQEDRPSFRAIVHTIRRYQFKLIDGIDDKIPIIENQLKSIIKMK